MKTVTREEFQQMLADYSHHMNVTIPVSVFENENGIENRTVLNNSMVYNPYEKFQIGMSNNAQNAKTAMKYIKNKATVYSDVFQFTTGEYEIID